MALTDCPNCGTHGMLATDYSLALYKCPRCKTEYLVQHPQCAYACCTAWADSGMEYCFFHAGRLGIAPPAWGDQHPCGGHLCNEMIDAGTDYCETCAEERRNPYD